MQGGYVDQSYGGYRQGPPNGAPIHPSQASTYGSADAYNAMAGPSRDVYGTYRSVSGQEARGDPRAASLGFGKPSLGMSHNYGTAKASGAGGPGSGASGSANDAPTGCGSGQQPGPSEFIKKLFKMLEDESATYGRGKPAGAPRSKGERGSVGWGRGGTSFVVWDMNEFTTKVLPQTFRHSNFSSFVRQLNKYGFSKIKHVDEETGQIKENVWEFQHPNFQAGGKADLDSIKRKAVVPKKAAGDERSDSPARGLTTEDANRILEMENRMVALEEALYKTQEQLRDARIRENGVMSILRELVAHAVNTDKESPSSPDSDSAARVRRLYQVYEQVAQVQAVQSHHGGAAFVPGAQMSGFPPPGYGASASNTYPATSGPFPGVDASSLPMPVQNRRVAPTGRGTGAGLAQPASASPTTRSQPPPQPVTSTPQLPEDSKMAQQQQLYNGSPITAAYPTMPDGNSANGVPIRKRGESTSLSFVVDGMGNQSSQLNATSTSMEEKPQLQQQPSDHTVGIPTSEADASARSASFSSVPMQPPQQPQPQKPVSTQISANGQPEGSGTVSRRTPIKPSWRQTPRILVVEDDLVYRQLSSKFLEKFGCVVETVENAQQGIEKMNKTKYDLVLMDIFFGPSMDGRKATSLIRQFDSYTPIISMTSNVQTKDVESYIHSGMNDVLAKPFTKHGLFCILDKHLIHLKAIQLSGEVPRFAGVPPLSDQGIMDALATSAAQWEPNGDELANPLAGSGWSDDQYQLVLQQFLTTGTVPDSNGLPIATTTLIGGPSGQTVMGATTIIPNAGFAMARKRSIEMVDDDWDEQANKRANTSFVQGGPGAGGPGMTSASVSEMA
ncbi:hypothetical protein CspeluHIS016_0403920 [Cutaneotrichosporon spelunceum]|uniref:Response regulatory domain-containing protein n=1 Tax=Cutaneotrichosporon spelunceum TaxID=1672016 RepID=A0AAD3TVR8_9TREE|nr:hypothetical protein CspeluHIS016_0403920 [Cutaneotrichosporon spelunceum]